MRRRFLACFLLWMVFFRPGPGQAESPAVAKKPPSPYRWNVVEKENTEPGLLESLKRSFTPDFSRFDSEPDSLCAAIAEEISINVGVSSSLSQVLQENDQAQEKSLQKVVFTQTVSFNTLNPYYARVTFFQHLEDEFQQGFEPDFSYSFGAANYSFGSFSLEYSNFGGNRLFPDTNKGETLTEFMQGTITATYRYRIWQKIADAIHPVKGTPMGGWIAYNLTPEFGGGRQDKQSVSYGISIPLYKNFSFWMQGNWYPKPDQETAGDPDFIYGFGYYDWGPGGFILSYSNYAANSWPWARDKGGDFWEGSVFFGYNLDLDSLFFRKKSRAPEKKPSQARFPWPGQNHMGGI